MLLAGSGEGRVSRREGGGGGRKGRMRCLEGVKGNDRGAGVGNVIKLEFTSGFWLIRLVQTRNERLLSRSEAFIINP